MANKPKKPVTKKPSPKSKPKAKCAVNKPAAKKVLTRAPRCKR